MRWIRNYSETYNKPTSSWHIFHSLRVSEREGGFALTMCGFRFTNGKIVDHVPKVWSGRGICDNCRSFALALKETEEVPEELVLIERG